ncbi:MAG: translation initiation factor IF-3 [bacterium]|nr:translation initiation factor IF-3 [bacterium]
MNKRLYHRINHQIKANQVRVIDAEGKQIGILSLPEALKLAQQQNVDLVEITSKAKPPVCKLIDYAKFKYLEAKKHKKSKVKSKDLKEIRLTPFIGQNDLNRLCQRAAEFMEEGHKVKVVVKFTGRTINYKDFGHKTLQKVLENLQDTAVVEQPAKLIGRRLITTLGPKKK